MNETGTSMFPAGLPSLLSLLLVSGCCSTPPSNSVVIAKPRNPSRIWATPWHFVFGDAIKAAFESRVQKIESEEVVAWALKAHIHDLPTRVAQESIAVVTWTDTTNAVHFSLGIFVLNEDKNAWRLYPATGEAILENFNTPPEASQIARFIRSTNFGFNEVAPRSVLEILRVESYRQDPALIAALRGISERARRERYGSKFEKF